MKNSVLVFGWVLFSFISRAQTLHLSGLVEDARNHEGLGGASLTIFEPGATTGSISNGEGRFSVNLTQRPDSVRFSMIGYQSRIYVITGSAIDVFLKITLQPEPAVLATIVVRPLEVMEIVRRAAQRISSAIPARDFESKSFYREIIQDSLQYYSVAEALFRMQFLVQKKACRLQMEKGRSKEDVAYTRLFEDFHPGGGPEDAAGQSLVVNTPDFLNEKKLQRYVYTKDSSIRKGEDFIYVVSFDQRPGIPEALEKGKMYIDAEDFSLLKFEAANSLWGTPYIKSLKGTDKVFAEILHIDFAIRGWTRTASYTKIGDKLFLDHAGMGYFIHYREPKKDLNLNLSIHTELLITDFQLPLVNPITRGEEWKRKDLVANLPSDFDSTFWGGGNILSPTAEIKTIMDSISIKNQDMSAPAAPEGWQALNSGYFSVRSKVDSLVLVPLVKCNWEDNQTGGMLYKTLSGDFSIEAKIIVKKRSNPDKEPDNGFQQSGLIIRSAAGKNENHLIFSFGTGGSDQPKYFLKRTTGGKTRGLVEKTDSLSGWLRLVKKGKVVSAYMRPDEQDQWSKIDDYEMEWLKGDVQAGFSIMDRFAGNGPKQHPDMKSTFSGIKITQP